MKFALAKEAAAGNKLQTQLVNEKEALAKVERELRAAIKAGDAESSALAKQTVKLRENVKALDEKVKKEDVIDYILKNKTVLNDDRIKHLHKGLA